MPCTDGGVPYPSTPEYDFEAMLCGIASALGPVELEKVLKKVDWREAGVTKTQFNKWWTAHQAADEQRREDEARTAARLAARKKALAKLSPEDRKALEIRD